MSTTTQRDAEYIARGLDPDLHCDTCDRYGFECTCPDDPAAALADLGDVPPGIGVPAPLFVITEPADEDYCSDPDCDRLIEDETREEYPGTDSCGYCIARDAYVDRQIDMRRDAEYWNEPADDVW